MAFAVIIVLYVTIGLMSVAGTVYLARKLFSAKAEQIFFALFLIPIAAFYLAFTTYFGGEGAWRLETGAVIAFIVLGLLGVRMSVVLIIGYLLHGLWDMLHEFQAHGGDDLVGTQALTEIPLGYGVFCATYDWCMAAYFYTRRGQWRAAWAVRST
jgi:hypothetical protein